MLLELFWTESACKQYDQWFSTDKCVHQRINKLVQATMRDPFNGLGMPQPLLGCLVGYWTRRINENLRLVYAVKEDSLIILSCQKM